MDNSSKDRSELQSGEPNDPVKKKTTFLDEKPGNLRYPHQKESHDKTKASERTSIDSKISENQKTKNISENKK